MCKFGVDSIAMSDRCDNYVLRRKRVGGRGLESCGMSEGLWAVSPNFGHKGRSELGAMVWRIVMLLRFSDLEVSPAPRKGLGIGKLLEHGHVAWRDPDRTTPVQSQRCRSSMSLFSTIMTAQTGTGCNRTLP